MAGSYYGGWGWGRSDVSYPLLIVHLFNTIEAFFLAFILFGCCTQSCRVPTDEDIVGEWIPSCDAPRIINFPGQPDLRVEIKKTPQLTFNSNRTFSVENIHERILLGPWPDRSRIISTTGKWEIIKENRSYKVTLRSSEDWGGTASFKAQMEISKRLNGDVTLFFIIGDPDSGRIFKFIKKCW